MKTFRIVPTIYNFVSFEEFNKQFELGEGDILVTSRRRFEKFVKPLGIDIPVIFQADYGKGEPTDEMDRFLGNFLDKKPLREYGMTEEQAVPFAKSTVDNQQRILGNNYVELTEDEIRGIFERLY